MPVLHEYKHDTGIYLRSTIEGSFVTFQVYPSAETFFEDRGYGDGDTVGWNLIKPFWEQGYVYTGESGTTETVETHLEGRQLDGLAADERKELTQFFERQRRNSIQVPDDVHDALSEWHNGKFSRERARDLLFQSRDEQDCIESIREFHRSPVTVTGIDTGQGEPAYDLVVKDEGLRCVDLRRADGEIDLIITLRGTTEHPQGLQISEGMLERWRRYSPGDFDEYLFRDLIEHLPAIAELLVDIPGYDLALDRWDFEAAIDQPLSEATLECLRLAWDWFVYALGRQSGTSRRIEGTIDILSSVDYGAIATDELEKRLVFDHVTNQLSEGQRVTFECRREDGWIHAVDIRPRDEGRTAGPSDDDDDGEKDDDRQTKYGSLDERRQQAKQRAENGELGWADGEITRLDRKKGHGYVTIEKDALYFTLTALDDRSVSNSSPVRVVVSEDESQALYIEPREVDDEGGDEEVDTEEPLEPGQDRFGWLRYLNQSYGSLTVEGVSDTILLESDESPIRPRDATPGMAFTFEVKEGDNGLRARNLRREAERDRPEDEMEEIDDEQEETRSTPLDEETSRWISRHASNPDAVFDSIDIAIDFGIDPSEYEASIQIVGQTDGYEVDDIRLSDEGHPIYTFPLEEGGYWSVEHSISHSDSRMEIQVCPEEGPQHQSCVVDGQLAFWRPRLSHGKMTDMQRHRFIIQQGRYVELVSELLQLDG